MCSLFSCSTETQEEQPVVTGKNFALSLYSTDSIYQSGIDSLFLFYFPESSTPAKPIYFQQELAWGDPIVLQDLEPEPHTFITVACSGSLEELKDLHMELHRNYIRINRHDNVSENLFGGVLKADPVSGEKKFELQRLVGGVKINITNFDSLNIQGYLVAILQIPLHVSVWEIMKMNLYTMTNIYGQTIPGTMFFQPMEW